MRPEIVGRLGRTHCICTLPSAEQTNKHHHRDSSRVAMPAEGNQLPETQSSGSSESRLECTLTTISGTSPRFASGSRPQYALGTGFWFGSDRFAPRALPRRRRATAMARSGAPVCSGVPAAIPTSLRRSNVSRDWAA